MRVFQRFAPVALLLCISLTIPSWNARASGPAEGGRRVRFEDEPAGPYLLRVVTSPTPSRVENLYLEVRVKEAATGRLITDASVLTHAVMDGESKIELHAIATHDYAPIPTEYASHLPVPKAGLWRVTVQVESELGSAQVSFLERVSDPPQVGALIAIGAPVLGLLVLGLVFLRLQRQSQQEIPAGGTPSLSDQ